MFNSYRLLSNWLALLHGITWIPGDSPMLFLLLVVAVLFDERFKQRCSSFVRRFKIASPTVYLWPLGEGICLGRNDSRYTCTNLLLCDSSLQQEEKCKVDK